MKVVTIFKDHCTNDLDRVMRIVLPVGKLAEEGDYGDDIIVIKYKNKNYIFNRFDPEFIKLVEYAIDTNPYKHCPGSTYEGHLWVNTIDDRYADKKYWKISGRKNKECFEIDKLLISQEAYDKVESCIKNLEVWLKNTDVKSYIKDLNDAFSELKSLSSTL